MKYALSADNAATSTPSSSYWATSEKVSDAATCKLFLSTAASVAAGDALTNGATTQANGGHLSAGSPCLEYTYAMSVDPSYPKPDQWTCAWPPASTYMYGQLCCTKGYPLVGEQLDQCCGILKKTTVCLSPQAVVGVIGGYFSLWFTVGQGIFTALLALHEYRAARSKTGDNEKLPSEEVMAGEGVEGEEDVELKFLREVVPNGDSESQVKVSI